MGTAEGDEEERDDEKEGLNEGEEIRGVTRVMAEVVGVVVVVLAAVVENVEEPAEASPCQDGEGGSIWLGVDRGEWEPIGDESMSRRLPPPLLNPIPPPPLDCKLVLPTSGGDLRSRSWSNWCE